MIPDSISALIFSMKYKWLWTILVWMAAFIALPFMLEYPNYLIIAFISCGSLAFVGAMPLISGLYNTLHNILGIIAGIFSLIWCALVGSVENILLWWIFYILLLPTIENKWCFFAEIWCIISVLFLIIFNF